MTQKTLFSMAAPFLLTISAGCGSSSALEEGPGEATPRESAQPAGDQVAHQELPPAGYGTLRQDNFSVTLTRNRVEVKLTPLAESVIRLAAPDTYTRLHGLVESRQARIEDIAERARLRSEPLVFLVSFFTRDLQKEFQPTDLQILSRGILYRPLGILALTPTWGRQQLKQEESQSALYVFDPGIDLEVVFQLEYEGERSFAWGSIIGALDAERGRVYSRARS